MPKRSFCLHTTRDMFFSHSFEKNTVICDATGFTGSTATIIVGPEYTVLCIDGRYFLQATKEAKPGVVIFRGTAYSWLADNLLCGDEVHVCGWTTTAIEYNMLHNLCDDKKAVIHINHTIEGIHNSKEKRSLSFMYDEASRDIIFQQKCRDIFSEEDYPFIKDSPFFIASGECISWLLDVRDTQNHYIPSVKMYMSVSWDGTRFSYILYDILNLYHHIPGMEQHISPIMLRNHVSDKKYYYDLETQPASLQMIEYTTSYVMSCLYYKRAVKTCHEQEGMRWAHQCEGRAVIRFLAHMDKYYDQHDEHTAAVYMYTCKKDNPSFQGLSFPTISAYGAHGAIVHYRPTPETASQLGSGLYLCDTGGQYDGFVSQKRLWGTTDLTRTVWLGSEEPDMYTRTVYTYVLKAHIRLAMAHVPANTRSSYLDIIARSVLWEKKWDYEHSTGHGVGSYLSVHENPPSLSPSGRSNMVPGMIFSNEPGYYEEGWGGVRLENIMISQGESWLSHETISCVPFDHKLILSTLLTDQEKIWLNTYHTWVYECMKKECTQEEIAWLEYHTQNIS